MDARKLARAGAKLRGALDELDAKVALARAAGYTAMPEGISKRTNEEIALLAHAGQVLKIQDHLARIDAGDQVLVYNPATYQNEPTSRDHWAAELAAAQQALTDAVAAAQRLAN